MFVGVGRVAAAAVMVVLPVVANAQAIPPGEQPGRERGRFTEPPVVRAKPAGAAILLPSTSAPAGAEKIGVSVRNIQIVGSTVYRPDELRPLYAGLVGRQVSVQAIYDLARRITAKYGKDGYVLSRAIVPPQSLNPKGATVKIEVIEGHVDKVEWPPTLGQYRNFFDDYARKITADRPLNIRTLERYLLLAGDLPGLKFSTSLKASATHAAASTLVVDVATKPVELSGRVDNRGTRARGPTEFLGSATFNNLLHQQEALTLTWASVVPTKELNYVAGNYKQVLTSEGLTVFADASDSWGTPGTATLEALQYRTIGPYGDVGLSYPIIRSRESNLTVSGLFFGSNNTSDVLNAPFNNDRIRGVRVKVDADFADRFQGINQFNLTVSQGISGLGSTENGNPLASRLAGRVDFDKVEASASRTQPLFASFSAYIAGYAQYAGTPLLVPEQCGYGGRFFGRAFDPSELLGDSCAEALGELRYDVVTPLPLSQFQLYGFGDFGKLWTRAAAIGTPASAKAASAGAGLRLAWQNFSADVQAAKGLEGPRNDWRFFFTVAAKY